MLRGSTPIRLSQLDISPAIQAGALEQQAITNMYSGIQQGIQNFQEKQEKKQQNEMTVNALKQFVPGLGDDVYKAISKDPQILKSMSDIANIQQARQEQEILGQEMAKREEQESILKQAIGVNTTPEGTIDAANVRQSFIDLGGTDESVLGGLYLGTDYKLDQETGLVLVDGKPKFNVGKAFVKPTESELKLKQLEVDKKQAEVDKLLAQIEEIKAGDTVTTFDPEKLEGIDKDAYDYAMANPGTPESEEILIKLRAK